MTGDTTAHVHRPDANIVIATCRHCGAEGLRMTGSPDEGITVTIAAEFLSEGDGLVDRIAAGLSLLGVTDTVTGRVCACGCGLPLERDARPEAKYATGACRVRAHRRVNR